jgi:Uma2 family endonuclease
MAFVQRTRPRVSYRDLCEQPEDGRRYELYDGEVFVVPSPLPLHQIVALNIYDCLRRDPRTSRGLTLAAPTDIVLSEYNVVQPDVVYFEPARLRELSARATIRVPPDVAIEVLSPSTVANDRGRKMQLLARSGVKEYWLVEPDERTIELYRLTDQGYLLAQRATGTGAIDSPLLGRLECSIGLLFVSAIR